MTLHCGFPLWSNYSTILQWEEIQYLVYINCQKLPCVHEGVIDVHLDGDFVLLIIKYIECQNLLHSVCSYRPGVLSSVILAFNQKKNGFEQSCSFV